MMMLSGLSRMPFDLTFAFNPTGLASNDEPDHGKDEYKNKYGLNKPTHIGSFLSSKITCLFYRRKGAFCYPAFLIQEKRG